MKPTGQRPRDAECWPTPMARLLAATVDPNPAQRSTIAETRYELADLARQTNGPCRHGGVSGPDVVCRAEVAAKIPSGLLVYLSLSAATSASVSRAA